MRASYGLDFFPTIFEVVDADQLNADRGLRRLSRRAIRTGGSAWSTSSSPRATHYGLQKIYELVINNDPCYAYLLRSQRASPTRSW